MPSAPTLKCSGCIWVMLEVEQVSSGYGSHRVLFEVNLRCSSGRIVTLLGRNGMGKTTLIRTIMGQLPLLAGRITFNGQPLAGLAPYKIARLGVGLAAEGREIFPNLTVHENLIATARPQPDGWDVPRVLALFPALAGRLKQRGDQLSGGEQQMLSIARALLLNPKLLILDEATEGLSPQVRATIWRCLGELRTKDLSMLLIDKHIAALSELADHHYVLEKGRVVWAGSSAELQAAPEIRARHLGV